MPSPIINGTKDPVRTGRNITFDRNRGLAATETWESAGDNLADKADELFAAGIQYDFDRGSLHRSKIVATYTNVDSGGTTTDEVVTDTWQLVANEIQKDGRESKLGAALTSDQVAAINKALDEKKTLTETAFTGDQARLFSLLNRGSTHFAVSQYVLRHTTNAPGGYAVNVADVAVEKIYTTAQLLAECTDPGSWAYPMPGRLAYKIQNIPAPTARTDYMWGWRKLASTETTAANGRIEITTEYCLEQWSLGYYDPA